MKPGEVDPDPPCAWCGPMGWYVDQEDRLHRRLCCNCKKPLGTPGYDPAATLARLLAAGFDHAELCLITTKADPHPSYRFIGYFEGNGISYTQVAGEEGDLPRIEAAVLERLEALKVERAAEREREGGGK